MSEVDNKPTDETKTKDVRISEKQAKRIEKLMEKLEVQESNKPVVPPITPPVVTVDPKDQTISKLQDQLKKSQLREKASLLVQLDEESQKKYSGLPVEQIQLLVNDRKGRTPEQQISEGLPRIPPTDQAPTDPEKEDGYIGSNTTNKNEWK